LRLTTALLLAGAGSTAYVAVPIPRGRG